METDRSTAKARWGAEASPLAVYEYVFFYPGQGEVDYMYLGEFEGPTERRIRKPAINVNGAWTDEIPELANQGFAPVYNMMALVSKERFNAKIVLFQHEKDVDTFEAYFRESPGSYVAASIMGESKKNLDLGLFRNREVILWPERNEVGDIWCSRFLGLVGKVTKSASVADVQQYGDSATFDTIRESSPMAVLFALEQAGEISMERPKVHLTDGFSNLSGFIPPKFIEAMVHQYADHETGRIESDYAVILQLCDSDPAFKNFVKLDRATGQMCFHPCYHNSYDEADNAMLNRLIQYGVKRPGKDVRYDLIKTLSLREHAVFNSVFDHFNRLMAKYPQPQDRLLEVLEKIKFEEEDAQVRVLYHEFFMAFFNRAAIHTLRAFGESPVPNDLVPVFVGGQGVGKSRFARYLSMSDKMFMDLGDKGVTLGSPDCIRHISGKLLVELSEMSVYTKTEIGVAKAFISQTYDEFRQLYERSMTRVPRSANMVGTTNEHQFLRDMTGNRRFFPIRVRKIDHEFLYQHTELIEETWAFYWKKARQNPDEWVELSQQIKDFFGEENEKAMDLGFASDMIDKAISNIEGPIFADRSTKVKVTSMSINSVQVGAEIQRLGGTVPYDLTKRMNYSLTKLGYKLNSYKDNGRVIRAMVISLKDDNLLKRVRATKEQPEF